jgi:hypothetical protein
VFHAGRRSLVAAHAAGLIVFDDEVRNFIPPTQ